MAIYGDGKHTSRESEATGHIDTSKKKKKQCCACNEMFEPKDLESFSFGRKWNHKVVVCLKCKKIYSQTELMEMTLDA